MSYKIVATKQDSDHEISEAKPADRSRKGSRMASEGWEVVVTDGEEKALDPAGFEKLFELKQVTALTFVANEPEPLSEPEPA